MFSFTNQEKGVILFFAGAVFLGSCLMLVRKRHPVFARILSAPIRQMIQRKININTATQSQWEDLPAIGAYRARQIISVRQQQGGFRNIEEVRYVKGIGPYVFNQIKAYLRMDDASLDQFK